MNEDFLSSMTSPPPQVLSSPTDDPLHLTNQPFKYLEEEECKFGLFGVSQFSSCETCWSNRDKICHKQDLKFIQAAGSQTNGTNAFIMPESYEHPPVKDYSKEVGKLFIGGLPNGLSDPDLKENFSKLAEKIVKNKYGHQFASSSELLDDCIVITDTERKPRGFGFVRFRYPLLAIEVLEAFGSYGKLDKNNNIITHYAEHFNLGDPAKKIEIKPCSPKDHPVKKQLNPDMYARQVPTNESGSDSDQPDIEKMVIVSLHKETTTVEQVEHVMRFYGLIKSIERKSSYSVQIEYAHKQSVKLTSTLKTFKCNGATIEVKPLEYSLPRGSPFISQGITQSRETKSMPEQLNLIQRGIENMRTRENVGRFSISSPNNLNNFMMHKRSEMNANQPWLLPNIPEEMFHNMLYLHKCDWLIDVSLSPYQYVDQRETQQRIKTWHQMLPVLHDFQSIFCRKEQLFLKYGMDMVKLVIKLRETMTKWSFSNNSLDELTKRYLKWLPKYKEIQREKIAMEKTETFQYEECSSNKIDANKINCIFGWSSEDGSNCQICAANSKYLILTPESNTEAMYNITGVPEELGKLFVGGLNGETSKETLLDHFSQFGEIIDCVISVDKSNNNKSKGFGFVRFKYPKKAVACLAEYKRYKHNLNVLQSLLYASGKDSRALEYQVEIVRAQRKKFVLDDRNLDVKPCKVKLDGTIPMLDENAADEKKRCIHIYIEPIRNFINDTDVLEHLFTAFGVIEKCRIHKDRKWAFIEFAHWESARLAVSFDRKLSFGPALSSGKMHNTIQIGQVHENTNLNDSKFLSPNCEFDLNSPYLTAKVESNVGPRLKFGKNPEKLISYWLRPHMTFSDVHTLFVEPRTSEERLAYRAKFEMFCCVKTIQNCMQLLLDESSHNFDYLSKPIDRADFFRTLERYLDYCPQVERIFDEKFFNTFLEFLSELDNDMNNRQRSTPIHSGFSSGFSNPDYMNMDFQHEMNRRNEFSYLGYNPEPFERNTFGDSRQEISIHQRNQSLVSDGSTSSLFNQPFDQFNKRQEGVTSISPFENEIEGLRRQNITP